MYPIIKTKLDTSEILFLWNLWFDLPCNSDYWEE